jgi:hypothetical protein
MGETNYPLAKSLKMYMCFSNEQKNGRSRRPFKRYSVKFLEANAALETNGQVAVGERTLIVDI